jgi:uncharacterized Tic20 family protein
VPSQGKNRRRHGLLVFFDLAYSAFLRPAEELADSILPWKIYTVRSAGLNLKKKNGMSFSLTITTKILILTVVLLL